MPQDRNDFVDQSPSTPGKTQVSYPSPNVEDLIVTEDIQVRPEDYEPLDPGTLHPKSGDIGRELKLVWQGPVKGNDAYKAVRRIYATDRTDQDLYNYAIQYSAQSPAHPIYIRSYIELRSTYKPLPDGSTLPKNIQPQSAILVKEDVQRLDDSDPQIASLFVRVIRVYETLPGYALTKKTLGQQNLIPEKYRRLIRTVETEQPVAANYTFPSNLTGNQTFIELAQETIAKARLKIIQEIINTDESPLIGGKTGEYGNLIITEEVVDEGTAPLAGELIQDSQVTALGNGKAIRITVKYPSNLFTLQKVKRSIGQDNLIPEKYRRLVKHVETEKPVPVNYTFPPGLVGDQTFIEFAQLTITQARLKILEEIIDENESPLLGSDGDEWAPFSIYEQIVEEGAAIDTGYFVKKSAITPFGNGKAVKITLKYAAAVVGAVLVTNQGTGYTSAPTVAPSGGGGTGATFTAIVFAGKVIDVQVVNPGVDYTSPPTLAFSGGGGSSAAATTILSIANRKGQDYNQQYDAPVPYRDLNIPAGQGIGVPHAEVTPIDYLRSRAKVPDVAVLENVLGNFVMSYPGRINVDMPDKLVSVTALMESFLGEGNSEETGSAGVFGLSSVNLSLRGTAQASASIVPDAYPGIKQFWGNNIKCTHYHIFLKNPVIDADVLARINTILGTPVSDWPKFNPQPETLVCKGQKLSLQVNASSQGSKARGDSGSSDSDAGGTGYSKESGLSLKTVRIPPTIHPAVFVSGNVSGNETVSADASAFAAGVGPSKIISKDGTVSATINPSFLGATAGATDWPSTGLYLLRVDPDPFKYSWIQFHLVVLNAADFPTNIGGGGTDYTLLYYFLSLITGLTGGGSSNLDGINMASYVSRAVFEVNINGRGPSQWRKELVDGTPSSNPITNARLNISTGYAGTRGTYLTRGISSGRGFWSLNGGISGVPQILWSGSAWLCQLSGTTLWSSSDDVDYPWMCTHFTNGTQTAPSSISGTDTIAGVIVPPDFNPSTMNYVLIRIKGW